MNIEIELVDEETPLACYSEFRAELGKLGKNNAVMVFDYASERGAKEARSHIYKLRQTRAAVDRARKSAKEQSLAYGRRVDGEAKDITAQIEAMIDVHQTPLDEIEEREKVRVSDIRLRVQALDVPIVLPDGIDGMKAIISKLEQVTVDETFDEFAAEAIRRKKETLATLQSILRQIQQAEELERLRQEAADRERADRERDIADKAKREATEKAERAQKAAQERAEKEKRDLQERLEREKTEAVRAEREAAESKARALEAKAKAERDKIAREKAAADEEVAEILIAIERQKADKVHQALVNIEASEDIANILEYFDVADFAKIAEPLITRIAKGEIRHVSIIY